MLRVHHYLHHKINIPVHLLLKHKDSPVFGTASPASVAVKSGHAPVLEALLKECSSCLSQSDVGKFIGAGQKESKGNTAWCSFCVQGSSLFLAL